MKSAYELAMERLNAEDPEVTKPLTDEQRGKLAEISSKYKAKIAEKEIFLNKQIADARAARKYDEVPQIEEQLRREKDRLNEEAEREKNKIRGC